MGVVVKKVKSCALTSLIFGASWCHLLKSTTYDYNTQPPKQQHQQQMAISLAQITYNAFPTSTNAWRAEITKAEVPSRSCCASEALGRAPLAYCGPAQPCYAHSAAGPSPSSLEATSFAEPSAASDHSDAPPTAKIQKLLGNKPLYAPSMNAHTTSMFLQFLKKKKKNTHQFSMLLDDCLQFLFWSLEFVQTLHQQHGFLS